MRILQKNKVMLPSVIKAPIHRSSMENLFSGEREFLPPDQMAWPTFVLNLAAQITAIILCMFLLRAIWCIALVVRRPVKPCHYASPEPKSSHTHYGVDPNLGFWVVSWGRSRLHRILTVHHEGFAAIGKKSCKLRLAEKVSDRVRNGIVLLMHVCTKSEIPPSGEEGRLEWKLSFVRWSPGSWYSSEQSFHLK